MKKNAIKTNAARILDRLGIHYELREYEVDEADLSAVHAAEALGLPAGQVFKTLVVRGDKTGVLLACIPATTELELKKLAEVSGNKKVDLVALKEVLGLTGYIRGGVSPIGAKKCYPVSLDASAVDWPMISISAGVRGTIQMILDPKDLIRVVHAVLHPIARPRDKDEG